jgi:Holliday junction resolvase RusA-like endonuclease
MAAFEFTVVGPPISHQTKDKRNLRRWKRTIRGAARKWFGKRPPFQGRLKCTIINLHEGDEPSLDDDNMVKPIRDALNNLVYGDDIQIVVSQTQQMSINGKFMIRGVSAVLLAGFTAGEEFVYIRIEDAPPSVPLPQQLQ